MSRLPKYALLSTAILLSPIAIHAQAQPFEIKDRAELNAMIRDYTVSNPEILIEAQEALQAKEEARKRDAAQLAVGEEADALFNDPADAVYGNPDGDVTLVEFFDYNCPFCRRSMEDIEKLVENDPQLRVVVKEWPIFGEDSVSASQVSKAVSSIHPDRYREFHTRLMRQNGRKNGDLAMKLATEMQLDTKAIEAMAQSGKAIASFQNTNRLAGLLGANGTPTYVIGKEIVRGALGVDVLADRVAQARE